MDQKFHGDEKPENLDFETWSNVPRQKSRNSNICQDGILSIGNFMLMINNHFKKPKKCAPYFRGNMKFPIYFALNLFFRYKNLMR
jgi:hypothetical protein